MCSKGCKDFELLGEKKMNRFKTLLTISVFSLLVFGLPTLASAQWNNRDDDDNYGRNRNGNNGYYGNLKSVIKELKNDSKDFRKNVKRETENSRYNSYLKNIAEDFEKAADKLKDNYDDKRINKSYDEADNLLRIANRLESELYRARLSSYLESDWENMRQSLRTIADAYGIRSNGNYGGVRNGRNGRGNRNGNGNWRDKIKNIPFPF
jgi:ribosomal protein S20